MQRNGINYSQFFHIVLPFLSCKLCLRYFFQIFIMLFVMQQLASESWSVAGDFACGGLLDAFIVTCYKDIHVLRECASKVNFNNLRIIVYDFTRPR